MSWAGTWLQLGKGAHKLAMSKMGNVAGSMAGLGTIGSMILGFVMKLLAGIWLSKMFFKLYIVGVKLWAMAFVYILFTEWCIYVLWPLFNSAIEMMPDFLGPVWGRFLQLVNATEHFLPWGETMFVIKWLVLIKLFLLTWKLAGWIIAWSLKFINFVVNG